jgi:hypothetical protein
MLGFYSDDLDWDLASGFQFPAALARVTWEQGNRVSGVSFSPFFSKIAKMTFWAGSRLADRGPWGSAYLGHEYGAGI